MDPGQSQQQRSGFMSENMLNVNRGTPPAGTQPRQLDFQQQQRIWAQQEYDAYRVQQHLMAQGMHPHPQMNQLRAPVIPYIPHQAANSMHLQPQPGQPQQRFEEGYQEIPEEFELLQQHQHHNSHTLKPISPAAPPRRTAEQADGQKIARTHDSPRLETPSTTSTPQPEESEQNLRSIAVESLRYPIERAAAHVREDDNSTLAEKSRQIFGMSWLLRSCEKRQDANIPRNRIYAHYVATCDEFKLRPLNHATFGKLVRIIFPNIKTRRLGVRGQSKYHYCGVTLLDSIASLTRTPSPNMTPQSGLIESFSPASIQNESPANTSTSSVVKRTNSSTSASPGAAVPAGARASSIASGAMTAPLMDDTAVTKAGATGMRKNFAEELWSYLNGNVPSFQFPQLADYVDSSADPDVVATLAGLYKSHCRSLLTPFKTLQIQPFLKQYSSFQANVTAPVQRLLKKEETVAWVLDCDRLLFSELAIILAPLTLKPLSQDAIRSLQLLNNSLPALDVQSSKMMSEPYHTSKQKMVDNFVQLSARILAANESGQNVINLFMNPNDLQAMKADWLRLVVPQTLTVDIPCFSGHLASRILLEQVPRLLDHSPQDGLWPSLQFLSQLREQFPNCSSTVFLLGFSGVVTNALKEMTRSNGASFGCWWIYRTWADDWLGWAVRLIDFLRADKL